MKLDELKAVWKQEIDQSVRVEGMPMTTIITDAKKMDRDVRFRDFSMIFALVMAALLYLVFGWLTQEKVDLWSKLGVLAFIGATTVMSVALVRARRVTRSDDWTLRSRVEMEIEKVEKQQRLMNRVGYWFLLPMLIANGISVFGGNHARTGSLVPDASGMAIFATCCLLYGFTYLYVRWETKRKLDPFLTRLRQLHADLLG